MSRTFKDYISKDTLWRSSAGTDRGDRVFFVAGGTNVPALESTNPPEGIFTSSLTQVIREQTPSENANYSGLDLYDAFASARTRTSDKSKNAETPFVKGTLSTPFYFRLRKAAAVAAEARSIEQEILDDLQSLRSVDPNELSGAATLYDTAINLSPHDSEFQQGRARIYIYQGDLEAANKLVSVGLADQNSSLMVRSEWLLLRSILKMTRGDLSGAVDDCEMANLFDPVSARVLSQLAGLYLAVGKYDKSKEVVENLLNQAANLKDELTDDEWGHLVVLGYLATRKSRGKLESDLWLRQHFPSDSELRSPFYLVYTLITLPKLVFPRGTPQRTVTVQSPFFREAARAFLSSESDASTLLTFSKQNEDLDTKDPRAIELMARFYRGMKLTFDNSPDLARTELELAVNSNQKQFVEYWIAQSERSRIR